MSQRTKRYFELAKRVASNSVYRTRHGAVLTRGSRVLNEAFNNNRLCSFGKKFIDRPGQPTLHAELAVILGVDRTITEGAFIHVVRIDPEGEYTMSEPCRMCKAAIEHVKIRKVFFSINREEYGYYKV